MVKKVSRKCPAVSLHGEVRGQTCLDLPILYSGQPVVTMNALCRASTQLHNVDGRGQGQLEHVGSGHCGRRAV